MHLPPAFDESVQLPVIVLSGQLLRLFARLLAFFVRASLEQRLANALVSSDCSVGQSRAPISANDVDACFACNQKIDRCLLPRTGGCHQCCVAGRHGVLFVNVCAVVEALLELLDNALAGSFDDVAFLVFLQKQQSGNAQTTADTEVHRPAQERRRESRQTAAPTIR